MTSGQNPRGFFSLFSGRHYAAACLAGLSFFATGVASGQKNAAWEQDLSTWRVQHAADLQKPDGWLALAGLVWLDGGDNSMGSSADSKVRLPASAPDHVGVLHLEGTTVALRAPAGGFPAGLLVDGKPAEP